MHGHTVSDGSIWAFEQATKETKKEVRQQQQQQQQQRKRIEYVLFVSILFFWS